MLKVRTRFAPSPTGVPHVGNLRTALYNFLFAKNRKGAFILRIEDTDQKRTTYEHIGDIEKSLELLKIKWDERYLQSKRLDVYHKYLEVLKKQRLAYEDEGAWRLKINTSKNKISWDDLLHKHVEFPLDAIEDFIIIKSDGFPTYHFASVIDDHEMQISHVIRADEWISSTPKHLLLYRAFSWQPPQFCHIPVILGPDKKKLSKREGAKSVMEYINEGYLPEALINFLALLGWAPKGDRELFTLDQLADEFSLDRLNKNSPIFNLEKLNWFNKKYIQKYTTKDLVVKIREYYSSSNPPTGGESRSSRQARAITNEKLVKIIDLVRDRMTTLADFDNYASIFFKKGKLKAPAKSKIQNAKMAILSISKWSKGSISTTLDKWISDHNLNPGDFKNTLRLSVFADNTPPIYESLAALGKDETLARIDDALKKAT